MGRLLVSTAAVEVFHTILLDSNRGCVCDISAFLSGDIAVIQLSSDTLSVEYQKQGVVAEAKMTGGGTEASTRTVAEGGGGSPSSPAVEGEQVVRCDISIKGFHLQVLTCLN